MKTNARPVKIGVLLDIADDAGNSPMAPSVKAIEMRFAEAAESGELDREVELVTRMVNGLPSGTGQAIARAYEELAAEGVLGVIGPGVTDNCIVTQPMADAYGIPTMHFPGTELCRGEYGFHFQLGSLTDEGPLIIDELLRLGHGSVAVIRDLGAIGDEYFAGFDLACLRTGMQVAADVRVSPVAVDLTAAVARAKASGAPALVYLGLGLVTPALSAALAAARWAPPRFMNTAFLHGYMSADARRALEGWVGVDMVDLDNPVTKVFFDRLERRVGERSESPLHSCFYDMATMMVEGLRWAPVLTGEGLRRGLERAHQLPSACGGAGTVMGFAPWDRAAYKGPNWLLLRTVKDGKYQPYRRS